MSPVANRLLPSERAFGNSCCPDVVSVSRVRQGRLHEIENPAQARELTLWDMWNLDCLTVFGCAPGEGNHEVTNYIRFSKEVCGNRRIHREIAKTEFGTLSNAFTRVSHAARGIRLSDR